MEEKGLLVRKEVRLEQRIKRREMGHSRQREE
jgi:hypothetical protein